MAGNQEPEKPASETARAAERGEHEWSKWERQKLEVYRQEHPDLEPAGNSEEEGGHPA